MTHSPPPPRPAAPTRTLRQGPRPLALHMAATLTTLLTSPAGLPFLKSGSPLWKTALRGRVEELRAEVAGVDPDDFARAVDREMRWRFDAVLTGLERYRGHPYRRGLADPPTVWSEGPARLLDYGVGLGGKGGGGRPVLFVPSLINRHYILDLSESCSLMRWMAGRGIRPLLLDWGSTGPLERRFTLTDFVAGRLERALNAVLDFGERPAVVGYCMGGLLATALAQRRPRDIAGLALLATPWDFHADNAAAAKRTAAALAPFEPALDSWGELPIDAIQALFAMQDPLQMANKFTKFARMDPDGEPARRFRGAGGLGQRRRHPAGGRGARLPDRLVRPQRHRERALADRRRGRGPPAPPSSHTGHDPREGPHRAASVGAGACRSRSGGMHLQSAPWARGHDRQRRCGVLVWEPLADWLCNLE